MSSMLNMTGTAGSGATAGDLTAKARIRNAAFALYAAKGFEATSIREVAKAADVTPGLVVHHFGNKDGLRRAVQQHMFDLLWHALNSVPNEGSPREVRAARERAAAKMYSDNPDYLANLRRAFFDSNQIDIDLLDQILELTRAQVEHLRTAGVARSTKSLEEQAFSAFLNHLGPRLLQPVVDEVWARLAPDNSAPTPTFEVRLVSEPVGEPQR